MRALDEFARQKGGRDGRHTVCKQCRAARERQRYDRDREKLLDRMRSDPARLRRQYAIDLRRRYGISPAERQALVDEQGGRCAICGEGGLALVVDHDHLRGIVRALLCNSCNLALGHFAEDADVLDAAASYLEQLP